MSDNLAETTADAILAGAMRAARLGGDTLAALLAAGTRRELSPGDRLDGPASPDMPSGILLAGLLRYQRRGHEGQRQIVNLILPREVFRAERLARGGYTVEAATAASVIVVSHSDFAGILDRHPDLMHAADKSQRSQLERVRWLTWCILRLDGQARLCSFLDCAMSLWRVETLPRGSLRLTVPLSHRDMADLLAITPTALRRHLEALESAGVLRLLAQDQIEIFDPRGLTSHVLGEGQAVDCPQGAFG